MEKFAELISILLQHSQRFLDFWNFQIIIILGVLGFAFANQEVIAKRSIRLLISLVFIFIAGFSVFSLSVHQGREEKLWTALESRVAADPASFMPEETAYLDSLKPTKFATKVSAILLADAFVIAAIWVSPKLR
jgi:hypothetical protein